MSVLIRDVKISPKMTFAILQSLTLHEAPLWYYYYYGLPTILLSNIYEPWHDISNNVVCATSKGSDQPAHTRRLIRPFAHRLNIL